MCLGWVGERQGEEISSHQNRQKMLVTELSNNFCCRPTNELCSFQQRLSVSSGYAACSGAVR